MTFSRPSSHDNTSEPNVELRGENVFAHGLTHGNYFVASRTCRRNTIHTSKSLLITVSRMVFNAFLFPPPHLASVRRPPTGRSLFSSPNVVGPVRLDHAFSYYDADAVVRRDKVKGAVVNH